MRLIDDYIPPHPDDIAKLKEQLGYTGTQVTDFAGVAINRQRRKYTSGETPRAMSPATNSVLHSSTAGVE